MSEYEIKMLRQEVQELRKEIDNLYRFIGNFVDLTGSELNNTKKQMLTKFNPLLVTTEERKDYDKVISRTENDIE